MAFDLGSVIAYIKADISNFKEGIAQAKSSLGGFRDGLTSINDSLDGFRNTARIAAVAVAGSIALIGKSALDAAGDMEQNRIAFETMIGNADKAKTLLKDIEKFAKTTPFNLPEVVEGSKRLLAYNVAAEDIIPTFKMLGDISSGVGREKLPQLILAFGQVKAATKLTGAELRQFSEAGVPLLGALVDHFNATGKAVTTVSTGAKKTKVDVGELNDKLAIASQRLKEAEGNAKTKQSTLMSLRNTVQNYQQKIADATKTQGGFNKSVVKAKLTEADLIDMVSKGEVKFKDVQEALAGMTKKGGKFFDLMAKQSTTFQGTVANIQDSIGILLRSFLGVDSTGEIQKGSIFEKIKNAAFALMQFLDQNREAILNFFNSGVTKIGDFFNAILPTIQAFGKWVMENKEPLIKFFTSFGAALATLWVVSELIALITLLTNPITLIIAAVTALYWAYQTNFLGIRDIVNNVITWLVDFFNNYLLPYLTFVYNWWKDNWNATAMIFRGAWLLIQGIAELFIGIVGTAIKVFLALMHGDFKGAWKAIQDGWGLMWDGIKKIFEGAINMLAGFAGTILHWLVSPFEDAWKKIDETMKKIRDALDFTKRHSPSVIDLINRGVHLANTAFDKLEMPTIPSIVQDVSQGIKVAHIGIDLSGALIANEAAALEIAETIGDSIIKKLQMTIRT